MESGRKGEARTHSYEDHRHEPPHLEHFRSMLQAYMVKKGLRSTDQRRLIVETFFQSPNHVSIEELLAQVRAQDAKVGYATVYRTLKLLAESGVAFERRFGDGLTRYELADDEAHHDHLICVECGSITEFEEPEIEVLQEKVARRYGFELRSHKHEMYGVCPACRAKSAPSRRRGTS
jgi:Fur family ferric uptake transcriptional regulator